MVSFELEYLSSGWVYAAIGPRDQVAFHLHKGDGSSARYLESVRVLLTLYDCAVNEIPDEEHPINTVFDIDERNGEIAVDYRGNRFVTTYETLRRELRPFLADVFEQLDGDGESSEQREQAQVELSERLLIDLPELYERLRE